MKNNYLTSIFLCLILALSTVTYDLQAAVLSECDSINEELTSKFRFLGKWDSNGTPLYMDPASDEVSQALINFVNETLPESVNFAESNEEYFGLNVQLNTELTEASEVYLTLVHEGAGWQNTLGYYTYDMENPPMTVYDIDSLVVLFPNVSQPNVIKPGDKILLGDFPANTGIGYFLIAKGWVGDTICLTSHIIFTDANLNTFTTKEFRQQTILLSNEQENKFLLGFEDIIRPGGDNDFNDAVFYITAEPGAIDTTNIPTVPTALLSGDTTLCDENAPATLQVELTGQAPWTIVYNNGSEDIEISGIEDELFTFETTSKDTISLVSVKDNRKLGIVDGEAIIYVSQPKATLSEDQAICGGGEDQSGFIVNLEGESPYSLTFKVGEEIKTVDNITEDYIDLTGPVGQSIELISMSDKYCGGIIVGESAVVRSLNIPSLAVEGSGAVCGDETAAILDLTLDGEGPWTVNYELDGELFEVEINSTEHQLVLSSLGAMTFTSIEDANCVNPLSIDYVIENKNLPTASIEEFENICGGVDAAVDLALSGEGPWVIEYEVNSEPMTAEVNDNMQSITVDQSGSFELIGVMDSYCENTASGTIEIEIHDTPTAIISGDAMLCNDEEAAINIELTGIAPFTIVYSDGEIETSITTDEKMYEFTSSEFKTYTLVSVEDAFCDGTVAGTATINDGSEDIQVEIAADENSCFGDDIELSLLGETDNLSVKWSTEGLGQLANTDQITTTYTPAENETGSITFYAEVNNFCAVKTLSKEVTIIEALDAEFDVSPDKDLLTNTQITFTPSNNSYDEYNWDFGDGNSSGAVNSSTEYMEGGKYLVELTVTKAGCVDSGSMELEVLSKDELYVPNAFNPNAQNRENQVVKVYGTNIDEFDFSFKIVNRWGKVMYETNSFSEANTVGWDGVNNNTDEEQELNVFSYILKGRFIEGEPFERTGTVTQVK